MTRLSWGDFGTRFFEAGTDRGVLYLPNVAGVPWNGLISVSESPSGGEPKPYYIDGLKYINIATAEEFEATIKAFASPEEFDICDGTASIANGLFVTQQPRKPFALCYRTKIGNDIDGLDHGYKIHVVYNALAAPSDRDNNTIGDSTDPMELSWAISTTPPKIVGRRPTAHFVIDSRRMPKGLLTYIEDILYGDEVSPARLPESQELIDIFSAPWPVKLTNLVTNPRGRNVSGTVVVRTNLSTTPRGVGAFSNYSGATTITPNVAVTGNPDGFLTANRVAWAAGVTNTGVTLLALAEANTTYTLSAWVYVEDMASGSLAYSQNGVTSYGVTTPVGQWVKVTWTYTTGASTNALGFRYGGTVGGSFLITGVLVEKASTVLPYFDGGTSPDSDLTPVWTGAANASSSQLTGPKPVGWGNSGNQITYYSASRDAVAVMNGGTGQWYLSVPWDKPVPTVGLSRMTEVVDLVGGDDTVGILPYFYGNTDYDMKFVSVTDPVKLANFYSVSGGLPSSNCVIRVDTMQPGEVLYVREAVFDGQVNPFFFDGRTPEANYIKYEWTGEVDNSTSIARSWNDIA